MVCHPERSALIRECESVRVVEGSLVVERCGWFKREFRRSRVRDSWALLGLSSEVFGIGILRLRHEPVLWPGPCFAQDDKNVGMTKLGDATTLSSEDDWNASLVSHTCQQRQFSPLPVAVHINKANLAQPSELGFDI